MDTTKAFLKGPKNDLKQNTKVEAKRYQNFIIWSLRRLKLANCLLKVVIWKFLIIVHKRQKPKLRHQMNSWSILTRSLF